MQISLNKENGFHWEIDLEDMKKIFEYLSEGVQTDGGHHKQWYLEEIAMILNIKLPEHEAGMIP